MSNSDHGRPSREQPLPPADVRAPSHAERARTLVAAQCTGTLATLSTAEDGREAGFPHGSYVIFTLMEGQPLFLVSRLATHTKNLQQDDRASLLVHDNDEVDPLASGRVTLIGRCRELLAEDNKVAREVFLRAHPQARHYPNFSDFSFWRLTVQNVRYIGGFGRMSWVNAGDWGKAEADPLASSAEDILDHMNCDHHDALLAYTHAFTAATDAREVMMAAIDRYGFDLSVVTANGLRPARIAFAEPVSTATEARKALVAMAKVARERLTVGK